MSEAMMMPHMHSVFLSFSVRWITIWNILQFLDFRKDARSEGDCCSMWSIISGRFWRSVQYYLKQLIICLRKNQTINCCIWAHNMDLDIYQLCFMIIEYMLLHFFRCQRGYPCGLKICLTRKGETRFCIQWIRGMCTFSFFHQLTQV